MKDSSPVFFLVKNRALGDSIMGLSSVSYLRSLYPNATIIYAIPQWTAKLYEDVKTDADLIYPLKLNSISDILDLYEDLINLKVDAIHEMHQTGTGSKVFGLYSVLKNIPYTFHNHHLIGKTKILDQGQKKELIQRDLDGIYSFYGRNKIPNFLNFEPCFKDLRNTPRKKRIIFGVVATRSTKMWPLINFAELAQKIKAEFNEYEIVIPLSKSKADLEIEENLNALNANQLFKIVKLPLNKLVSFFNESQIYIGNDTGLKHLAIATQMKSITMFGPEPIREWHPYATTNHKAMYVENLACRTRKEHFCGLSVCDLEANSNMQCMKKNTVDEVLKLMKELCQ